MNINDYEKILKTHLSEKRFIHSKNVSKEAIKLARIYGADEEKAELAGLLHDITKEMPYNEQERFIEEHGGEIYYFEKKAPKLLHSKSGMIYLKFILGIEDKDLLNAVLYHTTGREGMSLLEKIIMLADFISEERDYEGVDKVREKSLIGLNEGLIAGISLTLNFITAERTPIALNSVLCYNDLLKQEEGEKNAI